MIDQIARLLSTAVPDCGAEEIAAVLWLVGAGHAQRAGPRGSPHIT